MTLCNVVLSTEPRGGKGGVATVVPMYLEALSELGKTEFIPTHSSRKFWGKFGPWLCSFFRCMRTMARERSSRLFFHLHPGSGFCIVRMLFLAIFLRSVARQRVLVYLHTPYLETYLENPVWQLIIGALARQSTYVIVLTSYARAVLAKHGLSGKARVIPNPFRACARRAERIENVSGEVTVLTMGRLVKGKGILETVMAMSRLPGNYRLVVAGDGELAALMREVISENRLESRVVMKGWVSGVEKDELLANANVFCLPSTVDSFGMSFVEAQCYDLPIVAFRHPPVLEVICPERAIFVSELAIDSLAEAIKKAAEIGSEGVLEGGAKWVNDLFGISKIANLLGGIIEEALNKRCP